MTHHDYLQPGVLVLAVVFVSCTAALADHFHANFAGIYKTDSPDGAITLVLWQSGDQVTGKMMDDRGATLAVEAQVDNDGLLRGRASFASSYGFDVEAEFADQTLRWIIDGDGGEDELIFDRVAGPAGWAPNPAPGFPHGPNPVPGSPQGGNQGAAGMPQFTRNVVFNQTRIDDATIRALELTLGGVVPDGVYWYDRMCGAAGRWGGPVLGFLPPMLNLGGPLPANASGGATNVLVNGRALHPVDLTGLMSLVGPVPPGRYWLDFQGNMGPEGGAAQVNLVMVLMQARAQASGAGAAGGQGGDQPWTYYKDYGMGPDSRINFGSFGNGDFFYSSGDVSWWPGK